MKDLECIQCGRECDGFLHVEAGPLCDFCYFHVDEEDRPVEPGVEVDE